MGDEAVPERMNGDVLPDIFTRSHAVANIFDLSEPG